MITYQEKKCPKCGQNHQKSGIFCSRTCANSRTWTEKSNEKRRRWWINLSAEKKIEFSVRTALRNKTIKKKKYNIKKDFDSVGFDTKRLRVIEEQNNKCLLCGIDTWNNQKITLDIDHINGDRNNNARENLRGLCPNCHSLTETFRGKNKKSENIVSDGQILSFMKENPVSIRKALQHFGLSARGGNYKRVKRILADTEIYEGYARL